MKSTIEVQSSITRTVSEKRGKIKPLGVVHKVFHVDTIKKRQKLTK